MGTQPSDEILNTSCEVTAWINLIHIRLKHSRELDLHSQEWLVLVQKGQKNGDGRTFSPVHLWSPSQPFPARPGSIFTSQDCHIWGHLLLILPKATLHVLFQALPGISVLNTENWEVQRCYLFKYWPPAVSHDEQCLKIILKTPCPLENSFLDCISCWIYLAVFYTSIAAKEFYLSTKRVTRTIKFLLVLLEK